MSAGKWRSLLAVLLLKAGEVVPADTLVNELWGDGAPSSAHNLISVYVHRLRHMIGDTDGRVLVFRKPGYMLHVADGETDVQRFELLTHGAREAVALGRPDKAAALLGEALELWRGQLLADVPSSPGIQKEAARLAELQLDVAELKIAADNESSG